VRTTPLQTSSMLPSTCTFVNLLNVPPWMVGCRRCFASLKLMVPPDRAQLLAESRFGAVAPQDRTLVEGTEVLRI
jgi:hypothetical protein